MNALSVSLIQPHAAIRRIPFIALLTLLSMGAFTVSGLHAQTILKRGVISGGGGTTGGTGHIARGTLSQTAVGRLARGGGDQHDVGFWYWAYRPEAVTRISIPHLQAEIGTRVVIPVHLNVGETRIPFLPRHYHARIRYNHTLLRPAGSTPACTYEGDDCLLEIDGVATSPQQNLAELEFVVALGDSESTPVVIEDFTWDQKGEERIATVLNQGELALLGVCRAGGEVRLIRSGAFASRLRVWPNPVADRATLEFVSAETGPVTVRLVDLLGKDVLSLAGTEAQAERLYTSEIDLGAVASGPYMLVYTTPTTTLTQRLMITR